MGVAAWRRVESDWEAKETTLQLSSWDKARRVVIVRQRISTQKELLALEHETGG